MKIILVFKTHFDIGFTQLARDVVSQYSGEMLDSVIETCAATADMGKLRYVWTMPAWPLTVMQGNPEKRAQLDRLVREGQIAFHALPFTSHTDFSGLDDIIQGLGCAKALAEEYGLPQPIGAKMTDVPGHGRILPSLLAGAGIKFLHLGCNAFASPPDVPPLFFWEGPDGGRVLTMYSRGGYGSALIPPEDWPFPVWMALMHTHDNCGPQSAEMIRAMAEEVREACPEAEILCGTMDEFYRQLSLCDLSALPVVSGDLADSWIHGVGSYPGEVRTVRRTRRDLLAAGAAMLACGGNAEGYAGAREAAAEAQMLFCEHTWGLDVKTWMDPMRVYEKKAFRAMEGSAEYRRMEESWREQAARAETAAKAAEEVLAQVKGGGGALLNPGLSPFTGWADGEGAGRGIRLAGRNRIYVQEIPPLSAAPLEELSFPPRESPLENHRYRLTLDRERGLVTELYDKKLGRALAREREGIGVFSYQYDVYGIEEMTEYLRAYAYRFFDWGIRDNGKDNYPECPRRTFRPRCREIVQEGYEVTLCYDSQAAEPYGDGREIRITIALPPAGEELFLRVELSGKEATPYVESGSLCLPLAEETPRFRFNKNGDLLDPSRDVLDGAGRALYCLEAFACAEGEGGGLCAVSHDAPLCAIGETGIYAYRPTYEPHDPVLYFNLFNNMWGTNFPQWIRGDFSWDFTVFGYQGACGGEVMDRALALDCPPRFLPVDPAASWAGLPEGMRLVRAEIAEGGWFLVLRDTALKNRRAVVRAEGWRIAAADLRGNPLDGGQRNIYAFPAAPFGVYGIKLTKN